MSEPLSNTQFVKVQEDFDLFTDEEYEVTMRAILERAETDKAFAIFLIRLRIDQLQFSSPESLVEIDGIELVQRAYERPMGEECGSFLFGLENPIAAINTVLNTWTQTTDIAEATVAFYIDDNNTAVHVGLVDNGYIISKWGQGNVYRHHPALVPTNYGNTIQLYIEPQLPNNEA